MKKDLSDITDNPTWQDNAVETFFFIFVKNIRNKETAIQFDVLDRHIFVIYSIYTQNRLWGTNLQFENFSAQIMTGIKF